MPTSIHLLIDRFAHERTPPPNLQPLQHEDNWRKTQRKRYESQQTTRPLVAQIRIHRHRRQWQKSSKDILAKADSGTRTSCVLGVGIRYIHHDGLHDDHSAETDQAEADGRQDPVEKVVACPSVPKDAAREAKEAAGDAEVEADFGKTGVGSSAVRGSGARKYSVLEKARKEADEFADDNGCLHKTGLVVFPAVIGGVDLGDALSRYEHDAV